MRKIYTSMALLLFPLFMIGQTLYVPSGTSGIGSSSNGNVGIGTVNPIGKLDINFAGGQLRLSGGSVAGGVWTDAGDVLYLADWNTGSKGLNLNMTSGNVGIGTTSPQDKLHVSNGSIRASDPIYSNINVRMDGTNIPVIRFTRWTGTSAHYNNAFVGQFYNAALSEYSFGIGSGSSWTGDQNFNSTIITATINGNVGIGTTKPTQKLEVNGTVYSREVKVDLAAGTGPDYVFEKDYNLPSLEFIKTYIDQNKHLPEVPSAKEMEANGINLGEMNMLLLKKIEELTLYLLKQEERIQELEKNNPKK